MSTEGLHLRIQDVIEHFAGGNQTSFARRVGISQSTLNRNLRDKDDRLLMAIVGWTLLAIPELNCQWLLTGEGDMRLPLKAAENVKSVETSHAQHVDPSAVEHLRYVIECQKHTLEIQARMLELRTEDFFKSTSVLGSTAAALSAQHHNE